MNVFAPTVNPNDTSDQTITNIAFYPDVAVADFRDVMRVQDTVTDERTIQALTSAMISTNKSLKEWLAVKQAAGYVLLADVPADVVGAVSEYTHHYLTAVYSDAKAQIVRKYVDIDTQTEDGRKAAQELRNHYGTYKRDAGNSIRHILGKPEITSELL